MNDSQQSKDRYLGLLLREMDRHPGERDEPELRSFAAEVLAGMDIEDLAGRRPAEVCATIAFVWEFLRHWDRREPKIIIFNPMFSQHGWSSSHTSVLVLVEGMPFVAESLRLELDRRNLAIHLLASSDLTVERDPGNTLLHVFPATVPATGMRAREALVYMEIARTADEARLAELGAALAAVVSDVHVVVTDFEAMRVQVSALVAGYETFSAPVAAPDRVEHRALLEWLLDDNFTFLGYEALTVDWGSGVARVSLVADSRLGLLRTGFSAAPQYLEEEIAEGTARADAQILFFKSTRRSRVHRFVYPDYVVLSCFDAAGRLVGQHAFLGLFTAAVYTTDPGRIPIVRRKVAAVIERSHPEESSHRRRSLERVLAILPRDELFQSDTETLFVTAMRIFHMQERRKVRLFVRTDRRRRFASCLLYWPRDVYRTELRLKIELLLADALGAVESEFTTVFSESVLVRTHFVMRLGPGSRGDWDVQELESLIGRIAQRWQDQLEAVLVQTFGEEGGAAFLANYAEAFPGGYRDDTELPMVVADIRKIDELETASSLGVHIYRSIREPDGQLHVRIYNCERAVTLSEVVPIFENLGMQVIAERPYRIRRADGRELWIHDVGVALREGTPLDLRLSGPRIEAAFLAVINGRAENDSYNRLVAAAGLDWREASIWRAYGHYMKQLRHAVSQDFIAETLVRHPALTRALMQLFRVRFDPATGLPPARRHDACDALAADIRDALEAVAQLHEDQVLRNLLALVLATVRTGFYRPPHPGLPGDGVSFKFDCAAVPAMPPPVPMFEIWVSSPRVEGVHLRRGAVARGGLRWSDRAEDFRTEVLGLVKAQQVKNAVIVPVGAKGGFVPRLLRPEMSRDDVQAEGIACYRIFVQSLLDLTDNVVDGSPVAPQDVVCHDAPDPYLVVAADKGTASFSDIANELSAASGFWLRDAFASGGSVGYDHKKMAITARGAWVSVERHFRELGVDVSRTAFTVAGIGDMSGDVFGNGLLRSRAARLVAAFDHRHVFVDPAPDPERSFLERERLFALPRSSWTDYDTALISTGGGVFPRAAKSISLTPEMRRALGTNATQLTPAELVSAVLGAPVDLLWFAGIGTYVKASRESHADAGDKANDALRIDATALRARVVGEGGNLGMTQLARVEFAARGGACNTDFIDNSGGVDCSDHEVNIKILLDRVVVAGDMTGAQRATLLEEMREEVAALVLAHNYGQSQSLSLAVREALRRGPEYRALISALEARGVLDRSLEFLPTDEMLLEREQRGRALTRPELAVLACYVKGQLKLDLLAGDVPEDGYLATAIESAFPLVLARRFRAAMYAHTLRRQIVATQLANDAVDFMGITFVASLQQSTAAEPAAIVRAGVVAREVFDVLRLWQEVEALDNRVAAATQLEVLADLQRLGRLATRWFIRNRGEGWSPQVLAETFGERVREVRECLPALLAGEQRAAWEARRAELLEAGLPAGLAATLAGSAMEIAALGIVDAALAANVPVRTTAAISFALNDSLGFYGFGRQLAALAVSSPWEALARESFLDELDWQVREVVGWVTGGAGADEPGAVLSRWLSTQSHAVQRWRSTLDAISATTVREYAMYAVAIRSLQELSRRRASGGSL
jgi:glutamate dehydrogenase